jgi:hypothetical protein
MRSKLAYQDPKNKGNSKAYHTGKKCVEPGCQEPAGTAWSKLWCFKHNVERIDRITKSLEELTNAKR